MMKFLHSKSAPEKSHLMELMRKKYHCTEMKQQRILYAMGGVKKVNRKQRNKHGHCGLMLCGQVLLTYMCGGRMCCNQEAREANVKMRLYTGEPGGRKSVVGYKKNIELNTEKV